MWNAGVVSLSCLKQLSTYFLTIAGGEAIACRDVRRDNSLG